MVAPLGEKARLLEKDKTFGASEGLEPLPTGATAGSTAQQSWNFLLVFLLLEKRPHINKA